MKKVLNIDKSNGLVTDGEGSVVFDPEFGPFPPTLRPNDVRSLFEATAEDGVKVSLSYVQANGGYLSLFADHVKFEAWTEQNEQARVAWLVEFLKGCGTPIGYYSWGKVESLYDQKAVQGSVIISYAAQQNGARSRNKKRSE